MRISSLLLFCPSVVLAQASVRGGVVGEGGEAIPYAVVVMEPGFAQRFANEDGRFVMGNVAPGTYRLMVRQVGFTPFDSTITVAASPVSLRIQLTRVAIRIADLTVSSRNDCRDPGRPDSSAGVTLATVFEQLRQNAERYQLLTEAYPFRYRTARRFVDEYRSGRNEAREDTIVLTSNARWPYGVGRVVTPDPDNWRQGVQLVHLPVLQDFADSNFQATHCFTLAGIDTVEGAPLVRLDFRASRRLREPDVNGTAYLDPTSFQIRRTTVTLTQVERVAPGVSEWTARTVFVELRPSLVVMSQVDVLTLLRTDARVREPVTARSEEQRLIRVEFLRPFALPRDTAR